MFEHDSIKMTMSIQFSSYYDKIYINIFNRASMSKAQNSHRSFSESNNTVHNTIDHILTKGAQKLYDKYIYSKVPSDLSNKLTHIVQVMFDPVTNPNHERIHNKDERAHEAIINKINLANEAKINRHLSASERNSKIYKSFLDKSIVRKSRLSANAKNTKNKQKSREVKLQPNSKEKPGFKKLIPDNDINDTSFEAIRADKAIRYSQQKQKITNDQQLFQQTRRHRQYLQQELKQVQENSQTLAFDYQTCRIIAPEPVNTFSKEKPAKPKSKMIFLKFNMEDEHDKVKNNVPKQNQITNIRKITSFERGRKRRHHEVDNESYNNNGERQYSTIPYLEIEEGVKMSEGPGSKIAQRPQTSRKPGTASTHRTFKSYTRERLESMGGFRTIDVIGSAANTRYNIGIQSKESKRTSNQTPKRSLLWSSRTCAKDHRISKNLEQFGTFFDFSQETIQ